MMRFVFVILWPIIAFASGLSCPAAQETAEAPVFERVLYAGQLGSVSALAIGESGELYTTDAQRGRVYKLTDRAQDGRLDSRRVIASGLQTPSGLAVIGERVFVSDAQAIWEIIPFPEQKRIVAPLSNSGSAIAPRPLTRLNETELLIGLTSQDGETGKLIAVNASGGTARLLAAGRGAITALATTASGDVWIGSGGQILPVVGAAYEAEGGSAVADHTRVAGLVLPNALETPDKLSKAFPDHIFVTAETTHARGSSRGKAVQNIYAVPTRFGEPISQGLPLVKGLSSRRSAGKDHMLGSITMDKRGIFVADPAAGSIWKIVQTKPKIKSEEPVVIKLYDEKTGVPAAELDPKGSNLTVGSTLTHGTSIETGSTIPEDEDEDANAPVNDEQRKSERPQ